ncbi:MAG: peptidase M61 [Acidobacteriaceae bacterium]|nr:peptidase M61 [Acidobacteriaceae bacterium]
MRHRFLSAAVLGLSCVGSAWAQLERGPLPVAMPPAIESPRDIPFPGSISLKVDGRDVTHRVIAVRESVPVVPGKLTMLYPEWIPGYHSGYGPIQRVGGLAFTAGGKRLAWRRDSVNMYAFHLDIPAGVQTLEVSFDYLTAVGPGTGRVEFTPQMLDLSWNTVLLYPAGYFSRQIHFVPSVQLPKGWQFASALEKASQAGDTTHFQDVTLNTLVDSPLVAGKYFERLDLSPNAAVPVHLDVFADEAKYLKMEPAQLEEHRKLVEEALKLFGSHHYQHYDFLLMLSNAIGGQGLEHHQSSEDATEADYFTNWAAQTPKNDLLAHEFVHSWNGKFRRPDALWTPNFNVPMRNEMLWVYEGLTQYWGYQLAARSGLRTAETTKDLLAAVAAGMQDNRGREWRSVEDTGNQPILGQHGANSWPSWERQSDYYMEGVLVWLDVDMKIRELSHGSRSLDDFAKRFAGVRDGSVVTDVYNFGDIVALLQSLQPYDWSSFLHSRVYDVQCSIPEGGFVDGGYRLVYNDTMPAWMASAKPAYIPGQNVAALGFTGNGSYGTSLGFSITPSATLSRVWWNSPAFHAGLLPGMQVISINGQAYTEEVLRKAITDAEGGSKSPIVLTVKEDGQLREVTLAYHEGLRYPHLERIPGTADRLSEMLAAH